MLPRGVRNRSAVIKSIFLSCSVYMHQIGVLPIQCTQESFRTRALASSSADHSCHVHVINVSCIWACVYRYRVACICVQYNICIPCIVIELPLSDISLALLLHLFCHNVVCFRYYDSYRIPDVTYALSESDGLYHRKFRYPGSVAPLDSGGM